MKRCDCTQGPELRQTGCRNPDADLYCVVCKREFWTYNGELQEEKPFQWPRPAKKGGSWEIKKGHWEKTS